MSGGAGATVPVEQRPCGDHPRGGRPAAARWRRLGRRAAACAAGGAGAAAGAGICRAMGVAQWRCMGQARRHCGSQPAGGAGHATPAGRPVGGLHSGGLPGGQNEYGRGTAGVCAAAGAHRGGRSAAAACAHGDRRAATGKRGAPEPGREWAPVSGRNHRPGSVWLPVTGYLRTGCLGPAGPADHAEPAFVVGAGVQAADRSDRGQRAVDV